MEIFIENQLKIVAYSFILGLIFGAAYDIIKIAHILCHIASYDGRKPRFSFHPMSGILFALFDLLYFLFVIPAFSIFVYGSNHGDFRLFLLLPAVVGFWVYEKTIGRLVMTISETIVKWIRRIFTCIILVPLRFLLKTAGRFGAFLYRRTLGRTWRWFCHRMAERRTETERQRLERTLADLLAQGTGRNASRKRNGRNYAE